MTTEQVPLAAQIEKVQREIRYARVSLMPKAERLWSAVLATLQQHERAMAALREPSSAIIIAIEVALDNIRELFTRRDKSRDGDQWEVVDSVDDDAAISERHTEGAWRLSDQERCRHGCGGLVDNPPGDSCLCCNRGRPGRRSEAAATPAGKGETG